MAITCHGLSLYIHTFVYAYINTYRLTWTHANRDAEKHAQLNTKKVAKNCEEKKKGMAT
jgi:hypothetical protein